MFLASDDDFQNQLFRKILSGLPSEWQTFGSRLGPGRFVGPDLGSNCLQKLLGKVLKKLFTHKHFC